MTVVKLPNGMETFVNNQNKEAYSNLIVGDYQKAERIYKQQYEQIRSVEKELPAGDKYHKGSQLFNWGISLFFNKRKREANLK
jgi:hypothetical protein